MSLRDTDPALHAWRQFCLDEALDLVDRVLFDGSARTQPGLRPAWQAQLREALLEPRRAGLDTAIGGVVVETLSGVSLLCDDEVNESIQLRGAVQAIDHEAEFVLRELGALALRWYRETDALGYPSPVLLEAATLAETLDRALHAAVPSAPRRLDLLKELRPALVREATRSYERQCAWLQSTGARAIDAAQAARAGLSARVAHAAPAPAAPIPPGQVAALFERLQDHARLGPGMRELLQGLSRLAQASAAAEPALLQDPQHPLWLLTDRLVALSQLDLDGQAPGKIALHQRLQPLMDALQRAPQPLLTRHYEQARVHLERLANASLPDPVHPGPVAHLQQAERHAELLPLVQAQVVEQLQRTKLLPQASQFLLGDWVRVITRTSARDGVDGPGPRRWTAVIDTLVDAAALERPRPPTPAELDCLLLEVHDGLRAIDEAPARIQRQVDELRVALKAWPRRAAASAPGPESPPEVAGSPDIQSSAWIHHADLATVPVAMDESPDSPAWRDAQQWLAGLAVDDLCRACLQGRWTAVRLDWISDNGQFFAFSRRQGTPFCTSRRVLERMRGEGLITTIPAGEWLRDAVESLPQEPA
ncbi:DUF1631 family protein [Ideonella sp. 4Y16]|uniref:DUF1631 family protein n=1 Tax=Ideonella alba TaxID=2824118 RepID=UPI001B364E51|nr:DUF1631 family protein [Ideonella alba]MBQ0942164.1 DUF1631 family protein [Ideonella alba]